MTSNHKAGAAAVKKKLCVWYAPLPEERNPNESASRAFADRIIQSEACDGVVEILDLERIKSSMIAAPAPATDEQQIPTTFHFFIISCDADGSVHKAVRKISRELLSKKATSPPQATTTQQYYYYAVALLGHARCENSAQQMKDTIFTAGRKFDKALDGSFGTLRLGDRVEVQAELEGPDESFDPWVKATLEQFYQSTL